MKPINLGRPDLREGWAIIQPAPVIIAEGAYAALSKVGPTGAGAGCHKSRRVAAPAFRSWQEVT